MSDDDATDVEAIRIDVALWHMNESVDKARVADRPRCVTRMLGNECDPVDDALMSYEGEDDEGYWEQPVCYGLPGGVTADWIPARPK